MSMPLEGIKVVEMTAYVVGPATAMILSDFGAEVVKVEPPDGDPNRRVLESGIVPPADFNYLFEFFNRNKKSIATDAKTEKGKEIIYKLVKRADVFVTNYRPAATQRLSIDYDTLSQINPRLVYAQITGYGSKGPGKDWPAFDETAFWARSGIMGILGEPGTPAPPVHGAPGDLTTSLGVFGGIMLALYHRERTGKGQKIDSSLLGTGVWVVGWDLQRTLYNGENVPRQSRKNETNPLHNTYQTKDGRWVHFSMAEADQYWSLLCKALDREDLLNDPRFDTHGKRCQNNELLISVLDEIMATKTLSEVKDHFYQEGLLWAPAQTTVEVANDPQVVENEFTTEYDHPSKGRFRSIDSPIRLSECPHKVRRAAPQLGQDTEKILLELGYEQAQIQELKKQKVVF